MKSYTVASLFLSAAVLSTAQLIYHPDTSDFTCNIPNGAFCAGDSLGTSIMITFQNGVGTVHDCCNDLNDGHAQCYQSSTLAGDAACSSNGTVYPCNGGSKFPLPPYQPGKGTSNTCALISSGDEICNCGPEPSNWTKSSLPTLPTKPVKSTSTPCSSEGASGGHQSSSSWMSSSLPANWSPTPTPYSSVAASATVKVVSTNAAPTPVVGVEVLAVAGLAALLL